MICNHHARAGMLSLADGWEWSSMEVFSWAPDGQKFAAWEQMLIIPIGDIQYQGKDGGTDLDRLRRHIRWGVENNGYFLGMGDYIDLSSPSNRQALAAANLYDSVREALDAIAENWVKELYSILAVTKGRWIGMLQGHHWHPFQNGESSDTMLCRLLDTKFLGDSAMFQIRFHNTPSRTTLPVTIFAAHGTGSGKLVSSALNKLEELSSGFAADIYFMAHQSKQPVAPLDYLYIGCERVVRLRHKTKYLVATGGFYKGYLEGSQRQGRPGGSYVEKGLMKPVALGAPAVWLTPKRDMKHSWVDVVVSVT